MIVGIYYNKNVFEGFGGVENYAKFIYQGLPDYWVIFYICDKNLGYHYYDNSNAAHFLSIKFDCIINLSGIDPYKTKKLIRFFHNVRIISILHMDPGEFVFRIVSKLNLKRKMHLTFVLWLIKKTAYIRKSARYFRFNYYNSTQTLVIAEEYVSSFAELNGISFENRNKINFILNPLISHYQNLLGEEKYGSGKIQIVWAGRNSRQKRTDLAHIFGQVVYLNSDYHFTIHTNECGYYSGFKSESLRFDLKPPFNEIETLGKYDILLLTSDFEGYPLIIIEALALGLWVICRNSFGAVNSLLNRKEYGIVYPYDLDMYGVFKLIEENVQYVRNRAYRKMRMDYSKSKFDGSEHLASLKGYVENDR